MAPTTVIADASALISLRWVDQLSLLPGLFGRVVISPSAAAEATPRDPGLPSWEVRPLGRAPDARVSALAREGCYRDGRAGDNGCRHRSAEKRA